MPKILTLADICYSWAADLYRPSCKFLSRGKLERKPPSKTSASATQENFFLFKTFKSSFYHGSGLSLKARKNLCSKGLWSRTILHHLYSSSVK